MQRFFIGEDIETIRTRAENAIDESFQRERLAQGFYAHKVGEARRRVRGEHSDLIEAEAKLRNMKPGDLAEVILGHAATEEKRELERVRLKQEVRAAKTVDAIRKVTKALGLEV